MFEKNGKFIRFIDSDGDFVAISIDNIACLFLVQDKHGDIPLVTVVICTCDDREFHLPLGNYINFDSIFTKLFY